MGFSLPSSLPSTRLGWYSVGLAAAFVVLFIVNAAVFLPAPGVQLPRLQHPPAAAWVRTRFRFLRSRPLVFSRRRSLFLPRLLRRVPVLPRSGHIHGSSPIRSCRCC